MSERRPQPAFTLVELLVVIGVIAILASLLLVGLNRWRRQAEEARIRMDFAAIGAALDAYRMDMGDYPRDWWLASYDGSDVRGTTRLADYLIGPADAAVDGADGAGFRTNRFGGRVWGPYLPPDRFNVVKSSSRQWDLLDRWGQRIQYFPQWKELRQNVSSSSASNPNQIGPVYGKGDSTRGDAIFDERDGNLGRWNYGARTGEGRAMIAMVGDDNGNNYIDTNLGELYRPQTPYVLISAGRDGVFANVGRDVNGTPDSADNALRGVTYINGPDVLNWLKEKSDDIYNFER